MNEDVRLRDVAKELLARIDKERSREPGTPETHLIGGLAKVGTKLESLLRVALEAACAEQGREVRDFLPEIQGRAVSLRRATAGQLARALGSAAGARGGAVGILGKDLRNGKKSVIHRVVHLRNEAAHNERVAPEVTDALQALRRLVERVAK